MADGGRVIAGTAAGLRLLAPGAVTRPFADRVKQTLFAVLEPAIRDRRFLDLYAGSGAAGIEALSRGASGAVFIERDAEAVRTIQANLETTRLAGPAAEVVRTETVRWLRERSVGGGPKVAGDAFGAILVDPPYDRPAELDAAIGAIATAGPDAILAAGGLLVAKHFWKASPPAGIGLLRSIRERRFGETMLTFYRWAEGIDP